MIRSFELGVSVQKFKSANTATTEAPIETTMFVTAPRPIGRTISWRLTIFCEIAPLLSEKLTYRIASPAAISSSAWEVTELDGMKMKSSGSVTWALLTA